MKPHVHEDPGILEDERIWYRQYKQFTWKSSCDDRSK